MYDHGFTPVFFILQSSKSLSLCHCIDSKWHTLSSLLLWMPVIQLSLFFQYFPYISICFFSYVFFIRCMRFKFSENHRKIIRISLLLFQNNGKISTKIFVLFNNWKFSSLFSSSDLSSSYVSLLSRCCNPLPSQVEKLGTLETLGPEFNIIHFVSSRMRTRWGLPPLCVVLSPRA